MEKLEKYQYILAEKKASTYSAFNIIFSMALYSDEVN